jgi:hypothetical protein
MDFLPSRQHRSAGQIWPEHRGARNSVAEYLNGGSWKLVEEFVEIESGKRTDRPKLAEAIKACRAYGRQAGYCEARPALGDAHFLLGLEKAGTDFVCGRYADANRLTVGIMRWWLRKSGG